jgi:hypothetical protein
MAIRNLFRTGAGVVALLIAMALGTPATAGDVTIQTLDQCPSGYFCVWEASYYSAGMVKWFGSDADWRNNYYPGPTTANNNDYSWYNHGTACAGCDKVRVFDGLNYGGGVTLCLNRGQSVSINWNAQGRGSSHSWYGTCP